MYNREMWKKSWREEENLVEALLELWKKWHYVQFSFLVLPIVLFSLSFETEMLLQKSFPLFGDEKHIASGQRIL